MVHILHNYTNNSIKNTSISKKKKPALVKIDLKWSTKKKKEKEHHVYPPKHLLDLTHP